MKTILEEIDDNQKEIDIAFIRFREAMNKQNEPSVKDLRKFKTEIKELCGKHFTLAVSLNNSQS